MKIKNPKSDLSRLRREIRIPKSENKGALNMSETLIIIGGFFHLGFVVFHLFFWRLFKWKKDLSSLNFINRAVMQILNLCLIFVFLAAGLISIFYAHDLVFTSLGKVLIISISVFWFIRLIEQIVYFGLTKKLSVILSALFALGSIVYIVPIL
jgi:hypothetical protein